MTSKFHAGERSVQNKAGVPDAWREKAAGFIQSKMSDRHQTFFDTLRLLFVGLLDPAGRPWAVPLFGGPGVAKGQSACRLLLNEVPRLAAPLGLDTAPGAPAGVLGIDLATRQRVRVNGRVAAGPPGGLAIDVDQAFGNCPQYIQSRDLGSSQNEPAPTIGRADPCDNAIRRIIDSADTFFIASHGPDLAVVGGAALDVSHRGGRPGFLKMAADGALSFPDFRGNQFFNTLGNIAADGRVGLFVPDFTTGAAVLVTGLATIDWTPERTGAFRGAERIVDIAGEEVWHVTHALPRATRPAEFWPALDRTGCWQDANRTGRAELRSIRNALPRA